MIPANLTINTPLTDQIVNNYTQLCHLSQYEMMQSVQKYPKIAFFLAFFIAALLFIDLLILSRLTQYKIIEQVNGNLIKLATALTPFLLFILLVTTYPITEQTMTHLINPILIIVICLFLILIIYDKRKILKQILIQIRGGPKP